MIEPVWNLGSFSWFQPILFFFKAAKRLQYSQVYFLVDTCSWHLLMGHSMRTWYKSTMGSHEVRAVGISVSKHYCFFLCLELSDCGSVVQNIRAYSSSCVLAPLASFALLSFPLPCSLPWERLSQVAQVSRLPPSELLHAGAKMLPKNVNKRCSLLLELELNRPIRLLWHQYSNINMDCGYHNLIYIAQLF